MRGEKRSALGQIKESLAVWLGRLVSGRFWQEGVSPWLELVRFAKLLLVTGDVLAGAVFGSVVMKAGDFPAGSVWNIVFCCLLLNACGSIQKDWCDLPEERRLHSHRPLSSNRVPVALAVLIGLACACVGLALAAMTSRQAFLLALLELLVFSVYHVSLQKNPMAGAICAGVGRGLNLLLGASVSGFPVGIVLPVGGLVFYTACLAWLSEGVVRRQIPDRNVFWPAYALCASWLLGMFFVPWATWKSGFLLSLLCNAVAFGWTYWSARSVYNRSVSTDAMNQMLLRLQTGVIPWQAGWLVLAFGGGWVLFWGAIVWWLAARTLETEKGF